MSVADRASQMIASLAVSEPELDTSVGSPTRKIIDAVAEVVGSAEVSEHLLNYAFDIDSKSGDDLDDFVLMFGFTRFAAKRATGLITFSRPSPALQDYPIPQGTQVTTATSPTITFATVAPATLVKGNTSVEVPIIAILGGEASNLPAGLLTRLVVSVEGVNPTTTNLSPTSGGTNNETDADLITRFKRTVFRSMAGTADMFMGVALEDTTPDNPDDETATQAIVLGSSRRWREQVQIQSDGTATSTIPASNVRYVFAGTQFFGADLDGGAILTPGVHYTFDTTVTPPRVVAVGSALTVGGIYDLDFEYSPMASRNDPENGVTNRVDIWANGVRAVTATETVYFRNASVFNGTPGTAMYNGNFVRQDTNNVHPGATAFFLPLAYGPIIDFPDTLPGPSASTLVKGTDYWVVHDDTAFGYGPTSLFGLEFRSTLVIPEDFGFALSGGNAYTYNALPRDVEARARRWSLVTTDVRAHAAKRVYLRLNFAIMFTPGFDRTAVTDALGRAMAVYLDAQEFGTVVQVSDLIQAAHAVQGVDNIRFLNSSEPTNTDQYAIERTSSTGTRLAYVTAGSSPARATDLVLADNEVPVLHSVNVVVKAQNSFGSG